MINDFIKKHNRAINVVATVLWLSVLVNTDSYYSNYLYIGLLNLFAIYKNAETHFEKREKIITFVFAVAFASFVALANYSICLGHGKVNAILIPILIFIFGVIVFNNLLKNTYNLIDYARRFMFIKEINNEKHIFIITFLFIAIIDLLVLFLSQYPGIVSRDSLSQIRETLTGNYTNINPYWHTMIIKVFCGLGYKLFGNMNAAVATYSVMQILIMALIEAYANMTLKQIGTKTIINILFCLFFALVPFNYIYSMTMWKDVLFGGALLLLIVCFIRIIKSIGNNTINYILFFVGSVGFGLIRSNGRYALLLATVVFIPFLIKNHKKLLAVLILSLSCVLYLEYPYLNKKNVVKPDLVESLSIPAQQIARVVIDKDLTSEEKQMLNKIVDLDKVQNEYLCYLSDPMKDLLREKNNLDYLYMNIEDYIGLYIKLGIKHPDSYLFAFIDQTRGYYNSGYEYGLCALDVHHNELGIERVIKSPLLAMLIRLQVKSHFYLPFLNPIVSIGLHVWIIIACLYIGLIRKNKYTIMMTLPILAIIASLLIATPVFSEFRYAYTVFTCAYFVALVTIKYCK